MKPANIKDEVKNILQKHKGKYLTAYQIYDELSSLSRRSLMLSYSKRCGRLAGSNYSKIIRVAKAAKVVADNTETLEARKILFNISTDGIYTSSGFPYSCGIYTIKK